ncbi:MAG: hypothetical protein RR437_08070 [Clostridium sp.]
MRENGITSSLGRLIYRGNRDYRTFYANTMGTVIVANLILGLLTLGTNNDNVFSLYEGVSNISLIYFLFVPFACYRTVFKTGAGLYIYLTPIKKSVILKKIISNWIIGFGIFIVSREVLGILIVTLSRNLISFKELIHLTDIQAIILFIIQIALIISALIMTVFAVDIISVVKRIPAVIGIGLFFLVYYLVNKLPAFLTFRRIESIDSSQLIIDPLKVKIYAGYDYTDISLGQVGLLFIIALIAFVYALSIFEKYSFDNSNRAYISIGKFKITRINSKLIAVLVVLALMWGLPFMLFSTVKTTGESQVLTQTLVDRGRIVDMDNVRLSASGFNEFNKGYIISPYTQAEEIERATGIKHDYVEGVSDTGYQLILVKDNNIVEYIKGLPKEDKVQILVEKSNFKDSIYEFTYENEPVFKYIFGEDYIILKTKI